METRTVVVVVHGKPLTIRTNLDDGMLQEVVDYANRRLGEVAQSGISSAYSQAVLALLSVVEELVTERKNLDALKEKIRAKSSLLLDMLTLQPATDDSGDDPPL